jgi:plastocyanin
MRYFQFQLLTVLLASSISVAWGADARVIEIKADSYFFKPDSITVKVGEPVTLSVTNEATFLPHSLVIKAPEAGLDVLIEVRAGNTASATFTPTKPGTYEIYCDKEPPFGKSHKERGMHGKLIVE